MKRTALYSAQAALHAKFGSFGGWELPIYYTAILQEHQAVRAKVGLFDVSHLGHLEVSGPDACTQLQPLVTQDLNRLEVGHACYTPMLNPQGGILDEMIVYRLSAEKFRFVVNAGNADKVLAWIRKHLDPLVRLEDLRERIGTLAMQGPKAIETMERVAQESFSQLPRYTLRSGLVADKPAWVARTGYTGEDGFEIFLQTSDLEPVWGRLLEAGKPLGIQPIGLGARDTLRLEAGLPLYGNDLDETTTPLEAGLEWTIVWSKGSFYGKEALERQKREGSSRKLVGFLMRGPGIPRIGYPILQQGRPIGRVTSGTLVPSSGQAVGMGYVTPAAAALGTELSISIHGRAVPAQVVRMPFYRRRS